MQFWDIQWLYFLLIQQYDVHSFLKLINDVGLEVFIEWHEGLTMTTPGGMNVNNQQFRIFVIVEGEEMFSVSDDCC